MSAASTSKIARLIDRSQMLAAARLFFAERGLQEVDVPALSPEAPIDPYIDLVTARCMGKEGYLHSSPEYGMKRLLAWGFPSCYQLSHVFRDNELGARHYPEFTMAEWYTLGEDFASLIKDTVAFVALFLGEQSLETYGYEELFLKHLGCFPPTLEERDYQFATCIEPQLQALTLVQNYPPEQAMLSAVREGKAERFELFCRGIELANGYHELQDLSELRRRLFANNALRKSLGKDIYPPDTRFLTAQIPDCCGVAVGFDRLMMLRHGVDHIREIVPFGWNE